MAAAESRDADALLQDAAAEDGPGADAGGLSNGQTFTSVLKTALGAGVFSLPLVFSQAGWLVSVAVTVAMAALSAHTLCMLAQSERRVARALGAPCVTYPQLVAYTLDGWVPGRTAGAVVSVIIVVGTVAVCAAYVALVTGTLSLELNASHTAVLLCCAAIELALCQLRTFELLSFTSGIGNLAIAAGFGVVIAYGAVHHPPAAEMAAAARDLAHPSSLARVLGPLSFNFAVHFTLLPVSQSMATPAAFSKVVASAFGLLALINCSFATACSLLFRGALRPNVIDSMASGPAASLGLSLRGASDAEHAARLAASMTKWLLCLSLLLTVPLIMAAARELAEAAAVRAIDRHHLTSSWQQRKVGCVGRAVTLRGAVSTAVRVALVGVLVLLVWCIPDFGALVTLAGGVAAAACGFVLPPLVHLRTHRMWLSAGSRAVHVAIALFGCIIMVSSSYFATADMLSRSHGS